MQVISFMRILKLGLKNYWRHNWLTFGATLLMTMTLTMISVFLILTFLVNDTVKIVRDKIDVTIYFRDDSVSNDKITTLSNKIKTLENVKKTDFIDKDKALEIFGRLPLEQSIKDPINKDYNPLPRSIIIKTNNPDKIQTMVEEIQAVDSEKIICDTCFSNAAAKNKESEVKLSQLTGLVNKAGLSLIVFFILIAIINVSNIIKISIRARSDEIEIMRYVGASNGFIQGPFVIEGMLFGIFATIITMIFILIVAKIAEPYFNGAFSVFDIDLFDYVLNHSWKLIGIQLLIGVLSGMILSFFSIRRYLKI